MRFIPSIEIEKDGSPIISPPAKIDFVDSEYTLTPSGREITIADSQRPSIFLSYIIFGLQLNTTRYFPIFGAQASAPTSPGVRRLYFHSGGTFKNFYVGKGSTSGSTPVVTVTLVVNGVDTALTVTVGLSASWTYDSDTTHEVTINAGDYVEYKVVYGSGILSPHISAKIEFYLG